MQQVTDWLNAQLNLTNPLNTYDPLGLLVLVIFTLLIFRNFFITKKTEEKKLDTATVKENKDTELAPEAQDELKKVSVSKEEQIPWAKRLSQGLEKTRTGVWSKVVGAFSSSSLSDDDLEMVEEVLYTSDMSPAMSEELIEHLKSLRDDEMSGEKVLQQVKEFLKSKMQPIQSALDSNVYHFQAGSDLKVFMIVGVNGAGKTTTIGKLATKLKNQGAKVVVGACDTFRAAAVEQLQVWCERADVEMIRAAEGADPSGVAFDAVKKAVEVNADYCLIDTAGRLHTKSNLMDELVKTKKVMSKVVADAPHETLLVIDAITGQNALRQAEEFNKALDLSGLVFTKCDGSAKAGSAASIVDKLKVPISYIGVGESVEDINQFDLDEYLDALVGIDAKA